MSKRHACHNISFNKISFPKVQYISTDQPCNAGPVYKSQNQNDIPQSRLKNSRCHKHQQNIGKGHNHVRKTHNDHICYATKVSGDQPQDYTHHGRNQCRHNSHQQGNTHCIKKPAEHISSDLIRSQPEFPARRSAKRTYNCIRLIRSNERSKQSCSTQNAHDNQAHQCQLVTAEPSKNRLHIAFACNIHIYFYVLFCLLLFSHSASPSQAVS